MLIIGVEEYKFTDKETKKDVEGCTIHCLTEIDPKRGKGYGIERSYSISKTKYPEILPCAPLDLVGQEVYVVTEKNKVTKIFPVGNVKK